MKSSCAVVAVFPLLLIVVTITESRKELAGNEYWRNVMKDQAMPKAIHDLIINPHNSDNSFPQNEKTNCNDKNENQGHNRQVSALFAEEFEPTPNVSAYPDDRETDTMRIGTAKEGKPIIFADEFDPTPNLSAYPNDLKVGADKEAKSFTEEFEPSPNASVYNE